MPARFLGPGKGLTGNDTGGIIAYLPDLERGAYREMAANWCARWDRISFITSEHRRSATISASSASTAPV